jgi:hypothetical protein
MGRAHWAPRARYDYERETAAITLCPAPRPLPGHPREENTMRKPD